MLYDWTAIRLMQKMFCIKYLHSNIKCMYMKLWNNWYWTEQNRGKLDLQETALHNVFMVPSFIFRPLNVLKKNQQLKSNHAHKFLGQKSFLWKKIPYFNFLRYLSLTDIHETEFLVWIKAWKWKSLNLTDESCNTLTGIGMCLVWWYEWTTLRTLIEIYHSLINNYILISHNSTGDIPKYG